MADVHVAIVRDIESGATHRQAAARHGFQRSSVVGIWAKYRRKGIEALQAIRLDLDRIGKLAPVDPEYDVKWIAKIRARCVISEKGCWLWQGACNSKGYGCFSYRDKPGGIHRTMYRLHNGVPLNPQQFVLHRCDIRNCCNPEHLFLGTAKVNNWDCALKGRHHFGIKTQCPKGHPYDEANTYWTPSRSGGLARHCKECHRIKCRERWHRKRQEARQSV